MRKLILSAVGLVLVLGAVMLAKTMIANKNKPKPKFNKVIKTVFTEKVKNTDVPIIITANGNLVAKNKVSLFSEVQGVFQVNRKEFKPGTRFLKDETLLKINSDEFYASLQSQKSNLINNITAIMPDIRLDFPDEFSKWKRFLEKFDVNKTMPVLPKFSSEKEKYFVSGKGITTGYYTIKNLEVKLSKYTITAPFNGVLTEALVTEGTLVRPGQKLGEFIDPSVFEIEVSVNASYAGLLKVGNKVTLNNLEKTKEYTGKVVRVNGKVDLVSQTIKVYIEVAHADLKEGMYLEANLKAKSESNAFVISRKLLLNNSSVYTVKDTILQLTNVRPVFFNATTVVVKGLPENTRIITQPLPGAFAGMVVKTQKK
ncbi:MAG: HlyD family efflux transporter periplasmic adaptor subunit [Flavobacteriaceae bacterium]|nr:HlyD family efflux transporter periplasmic adaptor subunit [Flavobacteriaceae bacterium]